LSVKGIFAFAMNFDVMISQFVSITNLEL
jgi:hypothetical protein